MHQLDNAHREIKLFLEKNLPDVVIQTIDKKQGDEHIVIEINDTWVFRFAKEHDVQKHMSIEVQLLRELEKKIKYPIPRITYHFQDDHVFGYKKIPGTPLTCKIFTQLTRDEKNKLASDFAQFLYELHRSIPIDTAFQMGITQADWPLTPNELTIRLANALADKSLQKDFDQFIKKYRDLVGCEKRSMLIHNDLHGDNILFSPATKTLSGIIDFTSTAIGTPYHEFRYLHLIDVEFVSLALQAYIQKSGQSMNIRDAFLYCMATEFSRLAEAIEQNNLIECAEISQRIRALKKL